MKITGKLWLSSVILSLIVLGVFLPPLVNQSSLSDYVTHTDFALELKSGQLPEGLPHFFFQLEVIAGMVFFPTLSPYLVSGFVVLWHTVLTAVIVNFLFYAVLKNRPGGMVLAGIMTISLLLVAPITAPTLLRGNLYFGYFAPNVYHNPTINVIKTWAIPLFLLALLIFPAQAQIIKKSDWLMVAAIIVSVTVALLTKPNYLLALLSAIGLVTLYYLYRKQPLRWIFLITFFANAVILLAWQYSMLTANSGVVLISPFDSFMVTNSNIVHTPPAMMPVKLVLSILFPLAVTVLYFPQVRKDFQFMAAWLVTVIAMISAYTLTETQRTTHGNWYWGSSTALFVLFVVSGLFLIRQEPVLLRAPRQLPARFWIAAGTFFLHLFFGVIWYAANLLPRYYW